MGYYQIVTSELEMGDREMKATCVKPSSPLAENAFSPDQSGKLGLYHNRIASQLYDSGYFRKSTTSPGGSFTATRGASAPHCTNASCARCGSVLSRYIVPSG